MTITTATVQLTFNLSQVCRHTRVLAHLTHAKLQKLACAHTVAHNFGVCMQASEYMLHMRDVCHELALVCHTTHVV